MDERRPIRTATAMESGWSFISFLTIYQRSRRAAQTESPIGGPLAIARARLTSVFGASVPATSASTFEHLCARAACDTASHGDFSQ